MFDSLRCWAPLYLLLQRKLGHPTMPSLDLSFSPLPTSDLVSRESQKTRKFEMEGGLLWVRVSNQTDGQDPFSGFAGIWRKIQLYGWKEHDEISVPSKFQLNQTARSEDINISIRSIFCRWFDDLMRQQLDLILNQLIHEIVPHHHQANRQIFTTSLA